MGEKAFQAEILRGWEVISGVVPVIAQIYSIPQAGGGC